MAHATCLLYEIRGNITVVLAISRVWVKMVAWQAGENVANERGARRAIRKRPVPLQLMLG